MTPEIRPPSHLSSKSKAWFTSIADTFELEPHHARLLLLACEALDRGERARKILQKDGLTFMDHKGSPRSRPEVAIARDAATTFLRLCRELRLDGSGQPDAVGRAPRLPNGNRRTKGIG